MRTAFYAYRHTERERELMESLIVSDAACRAHIDPERLDVRVRRVYALHIDNTPKHIITTLALDDILTSWGDAYSSYQILLDERCPSLNHNVQEALTWTLRGARLPLNMLRQGALIRAFG